MKFTFVEKYGTRVAFLSLIGFSWFVISNGYHTTEEYGLLFPLNWLQFIPRISDFMDPYFELYQTAEWWMWAEVTIMATVWFLFFFIVRGIFYFCSDLEGVSMWVAFIVLSIFVAVIFIIGLKPAFTQLDVWWANWPGMGKSVYPDG